MASNAASASPGVFKAPASSDPDAPHTKVNNYPLLMFGMMLTSLMQVLDTTIANVALPHMQSALETTTETTTWILTSYIIASAVTMPAAGWLSSKIGAHRVYLFSIAAFVIASMLCGMAQNIEEMVIFRAMQGVAGAFFLPLSQSIMLDTTRPSKHAQAMALWGSVTVLGPILGPILGGWLTENWNWRWVFYINAPIGALSLAILMTEVPRVKAVARKFDLFGFLLIALAVGSLQLLLDRGNQIDWFDSLEAWIYLFVIVSATWIAIVHTITADQPLFERALFLDINLVVALIFMVVTGAILYATIALLPPLFQSLYGYDTIYTGLLMAPRGIGFLISTRLLSTLDRNGVDLRVTVALGFAAMAISGWLMSRWTLSVSEWAIIWPGVIQGIGMGFVLIPLNTSAFATLAPHMRTNASSLLNLFRTVGSSLGISIMASIFARNVQVSHSDLTSQLQSNATGVIDVSTIDRYQALGTGVLSAVDAEINRQAAMIGYINDFHLMVLMTLFSLPLVLLLRGKGKSPT